MFFEIVFVDILELVLQCMELFTKGEDLLIESFPTFSAEDGKRKSLFCVEERWVFELVSASLKIANESCFVSSGPAGSDLNSGLDL